MTIQTEIRKLINTNKKAAKKLEKEVKPRARRVSTPKHQHVWKIIGKTYAPPSNANLTGNMPPGVIEKALFGVTTLLWECDCGETKKEELLGSDDDLLESLIDKADKIGPQFVERRGKSYIISEWKPPTQNPNMIPVK